MIVSVSVVGYDVQVPLSTNYVAAAWRRDGARCSHTHVPRLQLALYSLHELDWSCSSDSRSAALVLNRVSVLWVSAARRPARSSARPGSLMPSRGQETAEGCGRVRDRCPGNRDRRVPPLIARDDLLSPSGSRLPSSCDRQTPTTSCRPLRQGFASPRHGGQAGRPRPPRFEDVLRSGLDCHAR